MRRIASIFLCMILVVTGVVMSSCSDDDISKLINKGQTQTSSSNEPMTIYIYGITDDSTTDTAIAEVEKALNEISIKQYNTEVKLLLFKEAEYAQILFAKAQTAINSYNTTHHFVSGEGQDETSPPVVNFLNVYGNDIKLASSLPSDVVNATLDIFLVYTPEPTSPVADPASEYYNKQASNMLRTLHDAWVLAPLQTTLRNYSQLRGSAYDVAYKTATLNVYGARTVDENGNSVTPRQDVFAVPNNYVLGGYEFIVFNKAVVEQVWESDKSGIAQDPVKLETLKKDIQNKIDKGEITGISKGNVEAVYSSYEEYLASNERFAYAKISGDIGIKTLFESNDNFEVYQTGSNSITTKNLTESYFAISRSTQNVGRCMDILQLLNTDNVFRNIYQYGVKETHYTQSGTGMLYLTGTPANMYKMNPKYSGNMFILSPSDNMSESMKILAKDQWALAKRQNMEMINTLPE